MRIKKSTKQWLLVTTAIILILALTFFIAYRVNVDQIYKMYAVKLQTAEEQVKINERTVYIAKMDIKAGTRISKKKLQVVTVASDLPEGHFFNQRDIGKKALIDISANVPLLKMMVTAPSITKSMREQELSVIQLSSNLTNGDMVDIRIRFPNGEDYVLLTQKVLKNISLSNNNCFLELNEEEIQTMSSAIIDSYIHEGTKIYTVRYLKPSIQDEGVPTYQPNTDVIQVMSKNPNILEVAERAVSERLRKEMDERLKTFKKDYPNASNGNGSGQTSTVTKTPEQEAATDDETNYLITEGDTVESKEGQKENADNTADSTADHTTDNTDQKEGYVE